MIRTDTSYLSVLAPSSEKSSRYDIASISISSGQEPTLTCAPGGSRACDSHVVCPVQEDAAASPGGSNRPRCFQSDFRVFNGLGTE